MLNKTPKTYNDGVLFAVKCKKELNDFSAGLNATKKTDFEILQKLYFQEKSVREQDVSFAESQGKSVSIKVKTRLVPIITSNNDVIIGEILYNIVKIDVDKQNREMYFYLNEVRKIEG